MKKVVNSKNDTINIIASWLPCLCGSVWRTVGKLNFEHITVLAVTVYRAVDWSERNSNVLNTT